MTHSPDDFVRHFRTAAPYIALHRDSTFVVVFPGTVIQDKHAVVRGLLPVEQRLVLSVAHSQLWVATGLQTTEQKFM
jgi:hypothetical protein